MKDVERRLHWSLSFTMDHLALTTNRMLIVCAIRFNFIGDREGFTYDNPGKSMMANIITNGAKENFIQLFWNKHTPMSTVASGNLCIAYIVISIVITASQHTRTHIPMRSLTTRSSADGDRISLGIPYGCDPANPVSDGCVGWSGFTDKGNFSMGSVDGQQHVMILLNGTGTLASAPPYYRKHADVTIACKIL